MVKEIKKKKKHIINVKYANLLMRPENENRNASIIVMNIKAAA